MSTVNPQFRTLINSFDGLYEFLSNFSHDKVTYKGVEYNTSEHAYQAAKTNDSKEKEYVRSAHSPSIAKKRGRGVTIRKDWDSVKISVMKEILMDKFKAGSVLAQQLIATGNAKLEEGNDWGDTFWGTCNGKGQNWLGKILMEIRNRLNEGPNKNTAISE